MFVYNLWDGDEWGWESKLFMLLPMKFGAHLTERLNALFSRAEIPDFLSFMQGTIHPRSLVTHRFALIDF